MLDTVSMSKRAYKSKRNVYSSCKYHIVWCPKYRRKVPSEERAERLKHIIAEVCQEQQALY
jgi:putative transposase